ncbi:MAG: hypothetical protein L0H83_06105 [Salinisphaera sp.]|nr:hypothetical protein [Salinisphaera sp.]
MGKAEKTWSLKEVDETRGVGKGTAVRAFRQLKEGLDEGRDYYYLSSNDDDAELETMRNQGRLYESCVNTVLLTVSGYTAVMDFLDD